MHIICMISYHIISYHIISYHMYHTLRSFVSWVVRLIRFDSILFSVCAAFFSASFAVSIFPPPPVSRCPCLTSTHLSLHAIHCLTQTYWDVGRRSSRTIVAALLYQKLARDFFPRRAWYSIQYSSASLDLTAPFPKRAAWLVLHHHRTSLHFSPLRFTSLRFTSLHFTSLQFTSRHVTPDEFDPPSFDVSLDLPLRFATTWRDMLRFGTIDWHDWLNRRRAGRGWRGGQGEDRHEGYQVPQGGRGRQGPACGARVRRGGARASLLPHSHVLLRRRALVCIQAALWGEKLI